ncbi:glycosyltransferase [Litoribacter ruber]|uniref:glycosyltransferase n=1 Tax=Litoribacter ruber TaxID=702568 RepID=UPI001BDA16BB|nr:glycosyltransferase [Litoribacter ruber]MBT0812854.1 glycosyltransferase [Litoribacter ruber]
MKVLVLSDPSSIHTVKWVNSLADRELEIVLFGLGKKNSQISSKVRQVPFDIEVSRGNLLKKAGYLKSFSHLKSEFQKFQPDLVHAHFISSYGLLGKLLNPPKYVVSVWGSDIFNFPQKSPLHRVLVKKILKSSQVVFSTSEVMREETGKYTNKQIFVTPFGVNLDRFKPGVKKEESDDTFRLGIVKSLEEIYGIDVLIKAFRSVVQNYKKPISLTIIGKGSHDKQLKDLSENLCLGNYIKFTGYLTQEEVIKYHQKFDLEIFPTMVNESFGVSVVEAMACGTPVIVSDVSGFKEVINYGECGLIVKRGDVNALTMGILKLIENKQLREEYISKGLNRVQQFYNWDSNVDLMVKHYKEVLAS